MSTAARTEWVAEGARPAGQPGEVTRHHGAASWTYPAIATTDGRVLYWLACGMWQPAPPLLAASFEAGPEWQADCTHRHGDAYRTCDTQAACDSLRKEGR